VIFIPGPGRYLRIAGSMAGANVAAAVLRLATEI
jgi:hypothetical protein